MRWAAMTAVLLQKCKIGLFRLFSERVMLVFLIRPSLSPCIFVMFYFILGPLSLWLLL